MGAVRVVAFYLPQFHPIAENDAWWGKGFTEWMNVIRARPLFRGHYQPHLPADLGYYDLRVAEIREQQAQLARRYGLSGFCYYHYWFNGHRVLERPLDEVLRLGSPDFPFCLCWANENWTRRWDGKDDEVLLSQDHSADDDARHFAHLLTAFRDPRYIRIDGKPVLLVYRTGRLPNPGQTAALWRQLSTEAGLPGVYLVRVESHGDLTDPVSIGFDAAVEFAPDLNVLPSPLGRRRPYDLRAKLLYRLHKYGVLQRAYAENRVYLYDTLAATMSEKREPPYTRFRCVTPGWDNSPRRRSEAVIFHNSTPGAYERWLRRIVEATAATRHADESLVFINAWNEWAEGNHLEPDERWGTAYLEATARALSVDQEDSLPR
jgi:lipopolysaccharide biosynthesis protein